MRIKLGHKHIIIRLRFFLLLILVIAGAVLLIQFIFKDKSIIKSFEKGRIVQIVNPKEAAIQKVKDQYKDKFVLIFFYDGYANQNEALNYINVLKATLGIVEPFKTFESDIVAKSLGTKNKASNVYATLEALSKLKDVKHETK